MRRSAVVLLPVLLVLVSPLIAPNVRAQTKTTTMVAMRDGTTLATDVWRAPGDTTAHPVWLRRTPYGRVIDANVAKNLTALGYVVVSQDVRGRGESKGAFLPFLDDSKDGPDTIGWVTKQPFSNGRIGSYSNSAEGVVQLMALGEGPAGLQCAHVGVASDDVYGLIYPGGAWRTDLTTNWLTSLTETPVISIFRQHEARDAFWSSGRLDAIKRARVKAAVFFMAAQFDIFSEMPKTFRAFQAEVDPVARNNQFMILGPWTHGGLGSDKQGEVTFPADAKYEKYIEDLVAYFDWCLKDGPRPTWPRVRSYVVHFNDNGTSADGVWRGAETWPPPLPKRVLYLHDDATLDANARTGRVRTVEVDPQKPVPSIGGGNLTTLAGPADQRSLDFRSDVLITTTAPVDSDVELIGEPTATIWASSTGDDFDVVVRLSVVTPGGPVLLVTDGVRRARFAQGYDAIKPVVPGAMTKMEIALGPISVKLTKGQSLRVAVQGTSSPRYEPNPGVARALSTAPTPKRSTLSIDLEKSSIELPTEGFAATPIKLQPTPPVEPGTSGCGCTTTPKSPAPGLLFLAALTLATRRLGARRTRASAPRR